MVRNLFEKDDFIEIFVNTSLSVAESRDPKGLYKKARAGEIPNFTGISSPYETPTSAEIILNTEKQDLKECVNQILSYLNLLN